MLEHDGAVLVTGGLGYVGRELVQTLAAGGAVRDLHLLDNLASGEHRLAAMDRTKFELHQVDLRDAEKVAGVIDAVSPSVIFHLAAVHYIPACEAAPGDTVSTNVAGTVNLLAAAPARTRFVFASTAAVYAPSAAAHVEGHDNIGPVDIYGYTKLQAEEFIRYFHGQGKVDAVIVRLFNVVGPGETNPHIVPAVIRQLTDGASSIGLGNLFPHRDYIDVSDAARGFVKLANVAGHGGSPITCNLGTGVTHSVRDVVDSLVKASGRPVEILQDPARVRAVDRPMLWASTEQLRALTGWSPEVSLASSMKRAWGARQEDRLG